MLTIYTNTRASLGVMVWTSTETKMQVRKLDEIYSHPTSRTSECSAHIMITVGDKVP